jgi:F1F0 ATPase subunit 2
MLVSVAMDAHAMMRAALMQIVVESSPWLAAGSAVGAFHFLMLRRSAGMLAAGSSLPAALALHLVRFPVTAGALVLVAHHGALPLLAAMLGILAARTAVVRALP